MDFNLKVEVVLAAFGREHGDDIPKINATLLFLELITYLNLELSRADSNDLKLE